MAYEITDSVSVAELRAGVPPPIKPSAKGRSVLSSKRGEL